MVQTTFDIVLLRGLRPSLTTWPGGYTSLVAEQRAATQVVFRVLCGAWAEYQRWIRGGCTWLLWGTDYYGGVQLNKFLSVILRARMGLCGAGSVAMAEWSSS